MDNSRRQEEEFFRVLDETLPVVRAALVGYYAFADAEAEAFENTLTIWFGRVARRMGGRPRNPQDLREQVLFVACKYARAFQVARFKGIDVEDGLNVALNRPAEEVAVELLNRTQPAGAFH